MNNRTVHRCISHMTQNGQRCMIWLMHDMISAWWYYLIWYMYMNDSMTEICIYVWSRYYDKCFTVGSHNCFYRYMLYYLFVYDSHSLSGDPFNLTEPWAHTPTDALLSYRFHSLTQNTGSPADQLQTLLLHSKNKDYGIRQCMYIDFWM